MVKIDEQGLIQWARLYGGTHQEGPRSVYRTTDGGYITAIASEAVPSGSKDSPHFGLLNVWVVKVDLEGRKQWERIQAQACQAQASGIAFAEKAVISL